MKAGKLIALGFSGILAAAGVTIATFEGQELTGYVDPVGIATTCYGHTETAVVGKEYTQDECLNLLADDLATHNEQLMSAINTKLSQGEHIAYLSFHYNVGSGNFQSSTLLKKLNNNDRIGACNELSRWIFAKGQKLPGLIIRREKERSICLDGVANVQSTIQQH